MSGNQFIPYGMNQVKSILPCLKSINKSALSVKHKNALPEPIIYYFARYLAGGGNLKGQAVDISLVEFISHVQGQHSSNKIIKAVAKQSRVMVKAKSLFAGKITSKQLEQVNRFVVNESNKKGYRNKAFWVGDLKIKSYAYRVCDKSMVDGLLSDFLLFLNDDTIDLLDRLIIGTHQFSAIHPFKDGNGRTWRNLFWSMLSAKYNETQTLFIIFYFKLIDYEGLYLAQNQLRKGFIESYVNYWSECIEWSHKALTAYQNIFKDKEYSHINKTYELDYWLKNEKRNVENKSIIGYI